MSLKSRACVRGGLGECDAQATVEMAIVTPVLLALALIVYNLMVYVAATARFDRVAPDIVIAHGVSLAGNDSEAADGDVSASIRARLDEAMGDFDVDVEVEASQTGEQTDGLLSMVGSMRTYRCEMRYHPWPGNWSIAGVSLGTPLELTHVREVAVDPWRSGVVV